MTRKFFIGPGLFIGGGVEPSPVSAFIKHMVAETVERAEHTGIEYPHFDMKCEPQANGDIKVTVTCTDLNSAMVVDPDAIFDK